MLGGLLRRDETFSPAEGGGFTRSNQFSFNPGGLDDMLGNARSWGAEKIGYNGQGFSDWFMNKATRLGQGGTRGAWSRLAQAGNASSNVATSIGAVRSQALTGMAKTFGRGALSALLPTEPFSAGQMQSMSRIGGSKMAANIARGAGKGLLSTALKWVGPIMTSYRIGTETQGLGLIGGAEKSARIVGEEMMMTGGAVLGGVLGTAIGGPVGTAVGIAAGLAIGAAGSAAWNGFLDTVEAPIKLAHAGWKYLERTGRRSSGLDLGGRASVANRSGQAYTMRQRALSQMNRSGINARSLLGQEASYMHIRG